MLIKLSFVFNASFSNDLSQQLDLEHQMQIESGKSNDFKEGVRAFFEKRQPNFTGTWNLIYVEGKSRRVSSLAAFYLRSERGHPART